MKKKRFQVGNSFYEIPDNEVSAFLTDNPKAVEVRYYDLNGSKYNIPIAEVDAFENEMGLKKKETSKVGSLVGGAVGTSVPQSEKQKLTDYLYGLKSEEEKKLASPSGGITTTLKQKPKKVEEAALNTINTIMYEDSDRWKDPVKAIVDESKSVKSAEDLDVLNKAAELTRSSLAGSGYHSKVLLADTFLGMEKDNMTSRMLQDKADKYDKIVQPFRDLRFQYGNQEADAPENDYNAKDKIYDAAIRAYANKNPVVAAQAKAAGVDLNEPNLSSKFGPKTGFIVSEILGDEDFIDYIQNENPKLYNAVKSVSDNLIIDQRDFGVNVVANEISKERQKSGFNNPIVEFDDKQFRRENDLVAQRLYADDPQKMKIYQDVISQNPDKYIDTQSLLEGFSQGAKGVYQGIRNTFAAPFKSISDQIKDSWRKEAEYVTSDPKGLNKFLGGTGHVLGLVAALGGVNNVLGAGGMGVYSQKVAPFLAGTVPFAGDFWQEGITKYPDSPVKAGLSAGLNTILYGAMSQRIFPTKEVEAAFAKIKPEIGKVVENLATGKITREAARQEAQTLLKKGFELLKGSVTKSAKISGELTAISAASMGLDKLLMSEDEFKQHHPQGELEENFKALFLDNLVLGGITKYSEMKKGNKILEESLYEAATNPLRYKRAIDEMEIKDPTISKDDMLGNLEFLSSLKAELDKRGISPSNQKRYLLEAAKERAIKKEMSALPESNITRRGEEQIARGQEVKDAILRGEDAENVLTQSDKKEIEESNKAQAEKNKLTEKGQKAVDKLLEQKDEEGKPLFKGVYRDIAKADPMGFLQEVADQVFGMERVNGERVKSKSEPPSEESMVQRYTADVVNAAKELFPLEAKKSEIDQQRDLDMGTESVSEPPSISVQMPGEVKKPEVVEPKTVETTTPTAPQAEAAETMQQEAGQPSGEKLTAEPPPAEPPKSAPEVDGGEGRKKGILNRLYEAKNVPQAAKEGFEKEGLRYETASQEEAAAVAGGIVDEMGVDEAVALAERQTFDGDVNSLIFAKSLDRLSEQIDAEQSQEAKVELAKKFAEVAISYDKMARIKAGRFNAAINYFYKKSPLGVVIYENAKRTEDFDSWAKGKDKNWQADFEELMKIPEFAAVVSGKVQEQLKTERQSSRAKRIEKVRGAFAAAKAKFKKEGGGTYSTIIPPSVIETALEAMELAYEAGEAVTKIIEDAVKLISDKIGTTAWDKDKFKKEWEEKLSDGGGKKTLTDEEIKAKVIEKFRKRLSGLTEKQKEDVIRKSHKKLIDNGALDYADLRNIIAEVTGRGELTDAEAARLKELVNKTNALEEVAKTWRTERTKESKIKYDAAEIEAARAHKELQDLFYNKPDITRRLTSIMQLSTLGIPALINNPIYNIWNQMGLRFPVGLVNDLIDRSISAVAKFAGKNYQKEYNIIAAQKGFWEMLGVGAKEAMEQIGSGLNRQDYLQKELYGQNLRPFQSMRDLLAWKQGKRKLTRKQVMDKALQATVGVPAEVVARLLNVGDKPQRFAAEGATAAQFAKTLGLQGMDFELFLNFPREEAYRAYKAQGLSDAEAGQKADYVKDAIVKEGQRSTFQQDNLINDGLTALFGAIFGGKDSGYTALAKTLTVSPFIKIPLNAFWSFYNLLNPEVAMLQAMVHGGRAKSFSGKGEINKSKLAMREARYWMAHAMVGIATRAVVIGLLKSGMFTPASDDDDSKKERDAVSTFDKAGTIEIGGMKISNRWFGQFGQMANSISKKYRDSTPEQREAQEQFWNMVFGKMELDALKEMQNGVFANSSALFDIVSGGSPDRYLTNTMNLFLNIVQPATVAQINRAALDEVPTSRGDGLLDKINQEMAKRSTIYRWATGTDIYKKRDMWGDTQPKGGNILSRMFGISKADPKVFARPVYEDYLRTSDSGFLPPAVLNNLNGQKLNVTELSMLEKYIGNERRKLLEPYINDMAEIPEFGRYSKLSDEDKKSALRIIYTKGREAGLEKFYTDFPKYRPAEETDEDKEMEQKRRSLGKELEAGNW